MGTAIRIDALHFKYRSAGKDSLVNINSEIKEGNFVVIFGHGGAGKTTLCFSLNGLIPRFLHGEMKGNVFVKNKKTTEYRVNEMAKTVGLVFQDFEAQLFCSSVELEVAFGLENLCLKIEEMEERIKKYIDFVGLLEKRKAQISSLSGGQKQRLAIGAILAMEPQVVVMDEPTTDLDPISKNHILSISEMLRDKKRTLVMVDTDYEVAMDADYVWLMRNGEVVIIDSPRKVLTNLDLLKSCGVMVPQTLEFFKKMGWEEMPLNAKEAMMHIKEKHPEIIVPHRTLKINKKPVSSRKVIIETKDLYFRYPSSINTILKNLNLKIYEGEFVAILGQNGSGKTTLARHFNRLLRPTSGEVLIKGKKTTDYKQRELARIVGYVFQNPDHQIFSSTVWDEVAFGLKMLGEDEKNIKENTEDAIFVTGLTGYEDKSPFLLTKGERQRVAFASILSVKPEVIVLDEPTTGLDYAHQISAMNMLKELNNRGRTIIIITHSMWIAEQFATRIIIMKDGSIIADGPTRDIFFDEDVLKEAYLVPSQIVRLSNWLGTQSLSVDGLVEELKGESFSVSR